VYTQTQTKVDTTVSSPIYHVGDSLSNVAKISLPHIPFSVISPPVSSLSVNHDLYTGDTHFCEKCHEVDTKTVLIITLIQPKITHCLSTFRLHVGSLHQDRLPVTVVIM